MRNPPKILGVSVPCDSFVNMKKTKNLNSSQIHANATAAQNIYIYKYIFLYIDYV